LGAVKSKKRLPVGKERNCLTCSHSRPSAIRVDCGGTCEANAAAQSTAEAATSDGRTARRIGQLKANEPDTQEPFLRLPRMPSKARNLPLVAARKIFLDFGF